MLNGRATSAKLGWTILAIVLLVRGTAESHRGSWIHDDRLTRADLPSGTSVTYTYDAQGLMASRTDASGSENYTWDGTLPYGQIAGITNAAGTLKSRQIWGTEHLAEIRNDTIRWLLTDGLGNVRAVTDSTGKIIGRQDFDAWGNRTLDSGRTSRFGYRGEWSDPATGLVFLRARWMDPTSGRFVSEDPFEGRVEKTASLQRYLYANESPVSMVDPNGREGIGEALVAIAIFDILVTLPQASYSPYFFKTFKTCTSILAYQLPIETEESNCQEVNGHRQCDKYGHYWIEFRPELESYGWWPGPTWGNPTGWAPGALNGNPGQGGSSDFGKYVDPKDSRIHHLNPRTEVYKTKLASDSKCKNCEEAKDKIREVAWKYAGYWGVLGPNCRTFQAELLQAAGLELGDKL